MRKREQRGTRGKLKAEDGKRGFRELGEVGEGKEGSKGGRIQGERGRKWKVADIRLRVGGKE